MQIGAFVNFPLRLPTYYGNNYGECEAFILITYTVQPKIFPGEIFIPYPSVLLLCVNDYILEPVASSTAWEKFIPLQCHNNCISIIQRWLGETCPGKI